MPTLKNSTLYCIGKIRINTSGEKIGIDYKMISYEENVTLDYRFDIDPHVFNICKKAVTRLYVIGRRLKSFIGIRRKTFLLAALFIQISSTVL